MTGSLRGDIPPVVRLGHDLVRNFEALPPDRAAVEIATHIRKFWEPRMRQELLARIRWGDIDAAPAARRGRRATSSTATSTAPWSGSPRAADARARALDRELAAGL